MHPSANHNKLIHLNLHIPYYMLPISQNLVISQLNTLIASEPILYDDLKRRSRGNDYSITGWDVSAMREMAAFPRLPISVYN